LPVGVIARLGGTAVPASVQLYGGVPPAAVQEFEYGTPTSGGPVDSVQFTVNGSTVVPLYG
jgi:hypothetical protein